MNNCTAQDTLHNPLAGKQLLNYDQSITAITDSPIIDKNKTSILVEKSKYRLTLYYNQEPIKSYPVVFGANPIDDKLQEGDKRTPQGIFTLRDLYPHNSWSKFLWIDYPTQESWQKHQQAKREKKIRPTATIGGEIGIHGVPQGRDSLIDEKSNWTLGCISLKNKDVDEIYQVVQVGTQIEIIP